MKIVAIKENALIYKALLCPDANAIVIGDGSDQIVAKVSTF